MSMNVPDQASAAQSDPRQGQTNHANVPDQASAAQSDPRQGQTNQFDPSNPRTYTLDALRNFTPYQILNTTNNVSRRHLAELKDNPELPAIQTTVLQATCVALANAKKKTANRMFGRTNMFACADGTELLRPCLGLKRTFRPTTSALYTIHVGGIPSQPNA